MSVRKLKSGGHAVAVKARGPDGVLVFEREQDRTWSRSDALRRELEIRAALLSPPAPSAKRLSVTGSLSSEIFHSGGTKPSTTQCSVSPTLSAYADDFLERYATVHNRPSEVASKRSIIQRHLGPSLGDVELDRLQARDVEALTARLLARGLSRKRVNNILAVLSKLLHHASRTGEPLHGRPLPEVRLLKLPLRRHTFLTPNEVEKLVGAAPEPWATMILVAAHTGLRLGELRALRWNDVDLTTSRLLVHSSAWKREVGPPKNGRSRHVDLSRTAAAALRELSKTTQFTHGVNTGHLDNPSENDRQINGYVFGRRDGSLQSDGMCTWKLRHVARRALGRPLGWHLLRHTFASHLVQRGAPLKAVQELLGHSSMTMTLRYAELAPENRAAAVRLLDTPEAAE